MSRRARASGGKKIKGGLWSLIRRMFGAPKGRHVVGASAPAESPAPEISPALTASPAPAASPPETELGLPVVPETAASAVQAAPPVVPTTALASIRLIFTDGSVVALPEGSVEGRQAQYLARRVLEAGRRP